MIIFQSGLQGFYDPCIGEEKVLYIRYKFHNKLHEVVVAEKDKVSIPKRGKSHFWYSAFILVLHQVPGHRRDDQACLFMLHKDGSWISPTQRPVLLCTDNP